MSVLAPRLITGSAIECLNNSFSKIPDNPISFPVKTVARLVSGLGIAYILGTVSFYYNCSLAALKSLVGTISYFSQKEILHVKTKDYFIDAKRHICFMATEIAIASITPLYAIFYAIFPSSVSYLSNFIKEKNMTKVEVELPKPPVAAPVDDVEEPKPIDLIPPMSLVGNTLDNYNFSILDDDDKTIIVCKAVGRIFWSALASKVVGAFGGVYNICGAGSKVYNFTKDYYKGENKEKRSEYLIDATKHVACGIFDVLLYKYPFVGAIRGLMPRSAIQSIAETTSDYTDSAIRKVFESGRQACGGASKYAGKAYRYSVDTGSNLFFKHIWKRA
jgi:hypothetical protein